MVERRNLTSAIIGIFLVLLGVFYLVDQFVNIPLTAYLWPVLVIAFGGMFFVGMVAGGPSSGTLAIPGSIIVTIGLISLAETIFGHAEGWSYSWALIVASVGAGFIIRGYWTHNEPDRERGWRLVRLGLILFLVFGAFFELVLGFSNNSLAARIFWPLALIGVGVYLFLARILFRGRTTL